MALDKFKKIIGLTEEEDFTMDDYNEDSKKSKPKAIQNLRRAKGDIVVFEIKHSDEVEEVADCLKEKRSCFVNMQRCDIDTEKTVINFLSGSVYALDGNISRVGLKMYLCTPNSVSAFVPDDVRGTEQEVEVSNKVIEKQDAFKQL